MYSGYKPFSRYMYCQYFLQSETCSYIFIKIFKSKVINFEFQFIDFLLVHFFNHISEIFACPKFVKIYFLCFLLEVPLFYPLHLDL